MNTIFQLATRIYALFEKAVSNLQSPLLLAIRLYWGWQFLQSGLGKLKDVDKVTDFFTSLGIPYPVFTAHVVGGLEFIGGILLILGLGSRVIALPLTVNMLVAYITGDREALLSIFSDPAKFYAADPFTYLLASLLVLVFGPGRVSLDFAIGYLRRRRVDRADHPHGATVSAG